VSHGHYHFGGLADNAASGQIHLPNANNTTNSEPTNIEPRTAAPGCVLWRANAELEPGNNCIQVGKLPVGWVVGRNLSSNFYLLFINKLG